MEINQSNKIYGRKFCVVGITQEQFDKKMKYVIAPMGPGIQWVLNQETLREYDLNDEIVNDFTDQLQKIGTIAEIRNKLNLQPMGGGIYCGLVLKHKKRPEVLANVYVYSGPNSGYNPNTYALPYDIMLEMFIDVDGVGPTTERDSEQEFKEVNALTHSGMGRYGWQDQIEVAYEDETKGVGPAENKMESKTPIDSGDYEDFYGSLLTESVDIGKEYYGVVKSFSKSNLKGTVKMGGKVFNFQLKPNQKDFIEAAEESLKNGRNVVALVVDNSNAQIVRI